MKTALTALVLLLALPTGSALAIQFPSAGASNGLGLSCNNYSDLNNQNLDMMRAAGVKWVQMPLNWAGVEKYSGPGDYGFGDYDRMYNACTTHGIQMLFNLTGPSAGRDIYSADPQWFYGTDPTSPVWQAGFTSFCKEAATRYPNAMYEFWAEPDYNGLSANTYMAIANQIVPVLRKAAPNSKILGPALSYNVSNSHGEAAYLATCCQLGLLNLVDAVSGHEYRYGGPESVVDDYASMRSVMQTYGGTILPIASTEWGYSTQMYNGTTMAYASSDQQQGDYLARSMLVNMSQGILLSTWFNWYANGSDFYQSFGIVDNIDANYVRRPGYDELQLLTRPSLAGETFNSRLDDGNPNDWLLVFTSSGGRQTLAAWTTESDGHSAAVPGWGSLDLTSTPFYVNPVPEPGTLALLATGLLGLLAYAWRRRK